MPKPNLEPQRTCLGCNQVDAKSEMIRIGMNDGGLMIDRAQTMTGRGGYLHSRERCLERFLKSKVREFRSLRRKITFEERHGLTTSIRRAGSEPRIAELR